MSEIDLGLPYSDDVDLAPEELANAAWQDPRLGLEFLRELARAREKTALDRGSSIIALYTPYFLRAAGVGPGPYADKLFNAKLEKYELNDAGLADDIRALQSELGVEV